ncbi:MAG: hypothetical protein ACPGUF_03930 [Litorivicinus sp.]
MFTDLDSNSMDTNAIRPDDVMEWFPELPHREACRLLWEWKARSNGRHAGVTRGDLASLLGDLRLT